MKSHHFIYLFLITIYVCLSGCTSHDNYNDQQITQMLYLALQKEVDGCDNISILLTENNEDFNVVLFSYDYPETHHVECRFFNIRENSVNFSGGGGGVADTKHPMSFGSHFIIQEAPKDSFLITFGEIYDSQINSVKINYSDDRTALAEVQNKGYIAIRKMPVDGVSSISGLDEKANIIVTIP